jgi:iron complex outermembrane receptor protein
MDAVVVTGTLIRGTRTVGSPVVSLSRTDLERSPAATVVDLLRDLPQIANLGASDTHLSTTQNANQNVTAGSGINLRGLGPESTLVLVSGRRIAPGGVAGQYTDPSSIPALAVERLEVVTDGASATYGSDAVGGVVNLRLRRNFSGAEAMLRYGSADGMHQKQAGLIVGSQWTGGSAMLALDGNSRSELNATSRPFFTDDLRPWGGPDLRGFNAAPGNVQIGSTRYAIPAGQNGIGLAASRLVAGTANKQSAHQGVSVLPAQERNGGVFNVVQELNDSVTLTLEGFWSQRRFDRSISAVSGNYTVRATNPFFVTPVAGGTSEVINYSFYGDTGAAKSIGFERSQQFAAVLDFDLPARWRGNFHVAHSTTQNRNLIDIVNNNAVNTALADTNAATSLNLFCDGAAFKCNNPATIAGLIGYQDRNAKFSMLDFAARADGPLFSVPAGTVRAAVGLQSHQDKLPYFVINNTTTPTTATTRSVDNAASNPERKVQGVFAELNVPLVSAGMQVPLVQRLDMALAGRVEHYSDFGSAKTPKVGLSWVPHDGLEVRSTYSRAFRAPTMGDIDPVQGVVNVVDRVDANGTTSLRGLLYLGGNPMGLKPETATIKTFGLSFKPTSLRGLTASLDWFDIDYRNRILTPGNDVTVLQRPELAAYVNRAPTAAQLDAAKANPVYSGSQAESLNTIKFIVDGRRQNAGAVRQTGMDLALRYVTPSPIGQLTGGFTATYLSKYEQQFTPTTPMVGGLLNTLNNPLRLRGRLELGWAMDALASVSLFANHANAYTNASLATRPQVAALTTLDLNARLSLASWLPKEHIKDAALTLSVVNLSDKQPPYVQNGNLAFDPQTASAIGRMVSVGINGRW